MVCDLLFRSLVSDILKEEIILSANILKIDQFQFQINAFYSSKNPEKQMITVSTKILISSTTFLNIDNDKKKKVFEHQISILE